jgi:hypothetical protein
MQRGQKRSKVKTVVQPHQLSSPNHFIDISVVRTIYDAGRLRPSEIVDHVQGHIENVEYFGGKLNKMEPFEIDALTHNEDVTHIIAKAVQSEDVMMKNTREEIKTHQVTIESLYTRMNELDDKLQRTLEKQANDFNDELAKRANDFNDKLAKQANDCKAQLAKQANDCKAQLAKHESRITKLEQKSLQIEAVLLGGDVAYMAKWHFGEDKFENITDVSDEEWSDTGRKLINARLAIAHPGQYGKYANQHLSVIKNHLKEHYPDDNPSLKQSIDTFIDKTAQYTKNQKLSFPQTSQKRVRDDNEAVDGTPLYKRNRPL